MNWLYRLADSLRDRGRKRFWTADHASGRRAEDLAHRFLRRRGMVIVARNYKPPGGAGEIDLIGWDGDQLVFVEVKSRASGEFGEPEQAVDAEKQRLIERSARDYARRTGVDWERARFDIVSVVFSDPVRLEFHADAFGPRRTIYNTTSD
jgi:putative endonuclease